jgi:lysophospholipase L1-like esterase
MTDRAAALGNKYIVVSDIPDLDGTTDENGTLQTSAEDDATVTDRINAALREQYPDTFVDVTAVLSDSSTRTDGLHLTQIGYEAVAKAIAAFVEAKSL